MSDNESITGWRVSYAEASLRRADLAPNPLAQFENWFQAALARAEVGDFQYAEPNAMALATADADGLPAVRMVLLRSFDARGLVFFTNYASDKGRQLAANPQASVLFYWGHWQRQVRVTGRVERVSAEESAEYFHTRPRGSQIGAWASPQSQPIPDRAFLEAEEAALTARFADQPIPRPPDWGGYRLIPWRYEFWQGRPNRLHDRLRYTLQPDGVWLIERLAP